MAGPTLHQRVWGYLWHWQQGPGWIRAFSNEWVRLRQAGLYGIKVQLQDDGPVDRAYCDLWRKLGFKVGAWVRPSHQPLGGDIWDPWEAAQWMRKERVRLALSGAFDFNGEDEVRKADIDTGGEWSLTMATQWRNLHPNLPLHFDSYWGSMGGGVNLGAWKQHGARFAVQTYWGQEGLYDDPPTKIVAKLAAASPPIHKSVIKPIIRVTKNNSGQLPDYEVIFADCKAAGTIGLGFYTLDGVHDVDWLCDKIRDAISRGIAY